MQQTDPTSGQAGRSAVAMALGLGSQLLAGMVVCTWLGWWVDQKRGGGSAWTLTGIFLGLLYGGYEVWKVVVVLNREANEQPKRPGSGK